MEINDVSNFDVIENVCNSQGDSPCENKKAVLYQQNIGKRTETWDEYYYNTALQVASNSKCLSRQIGAVLVKDKSIIGTGYNGPPRGVPHCGVRHKYDSRLMDEYVKRGFLLTEEDKVVVCPRKVLNYKSGEGLSWCVAGHAERNALINSAREGISTKGAKLYLTCGVPCTPCMVEIINAGISEVIVTSFEVYDESSMYLVNNSDIKMRTYHFINDSE